jgi:asparagine synthase (glutamine-hydrolysing)
MCGFVGFFGGGGTHAGDQVLRLMSEKIVHRGPDDSGIWCDSDRRVFLAHRRLSVLDLSPAGSQPMTSISNRYVIAFNGEIYNHLQLRLELEQLGFNLGLNSRWLGHSDTETLLAGFEIWGIKKTIERCIGMFAFAVWDKKECVLTLARDRMGEKPLYYGWQGIGDHACFLFGSELKALKAHPSFCSEISRDALRLFMRHSYIPAPYSIYNHIYKLEPGCLLNISLREPDPVVESYWSFADVAISGNKYQFLGSEDEAINQLDLLLKDSVRRQMCADVPLGAFLSGGVDSSTIVALMQAQSSRPIKTFTIGFNNDRYDEAKHAMAVARHLGTDHTEMYISSQQAMNVIPILPSLYCEPFADFSQIPTFLVSRLAREEVTVSLSGDAGDELFCGYTRYSNLHNRWKRISQFPHGIRSLASSLIYTISSAALSKSPNLMERWGSRMLFHPSLGERMLKASRELNADNFGDFYHICISHSEPEDLVIGGHEPPTILRGRTPVLSGLNEIQRMMALDAITYLPDNILVKIDRATMGVSLEGRAPFLDHKIVEFSCSLPQSMKMRENISKWVLREVLYRYVPKNLVERPKMGFGVPIDEWLRGPLRAWAESLLDQDRLRVEGYFNPIAIRAKWEEHLSGDCNWQYLLWNVLMFQSWLEVKDNNHN